MNIPIQVIRLSVVGVIVVAIVAAKVMISNTVEEKIDKVLAKMPEGTVKYDSVSTDLLGLDIRINDIKINLPGQKETIIDEIVIKSIDSDNEIPNYLDVEINGIDLDIEALKLNRQMAKSIDLLEYKNLKSNLELSYSFNKDEESVDIENISFAIEDAGKLSLNSKLHGIKSLENIAMQFMYNPERIKVSNSSIIYDDDSLTNRLMKLAAHDDGTSVGTFKEKILTKLSEELKKSENKDHKYETKVLEELIAFWNNPDSFEVSISPEEAISFNQMRRIQNPEEFIKKVNLDISAN